jgi:hypothetical protein
MAKKILGACLSGIVKIGVVPIKKKFTLLVFFGISLTIYAQNGFEVVSTEYVGNLTNHQFLTDAANVNTVKNLFQQNVGKTIIVDKFFHIGDDDEDAEDVAVINWVVNNELPVWPNDGDCFWVGVVRGKNGNSVDGWEILLRYSRNNWWSYILYYFSIHSK